MEEFKERHSARTGLMSTFYEIALEEFDVYKKHLSEMASLEAKGKEFYDEVIENKTYQFERFLKIGDIIGVEHRIRKSYIKIVIFLSTFLEAYIWDLAAITLGQTYTKDYLDKLDVISKWKVIPKLITGKELEFESKDISDFRTLVRIRNGLVHHKTKDYKPDADQQESQHEMVDVAIFFSMIENIFKKLNEIDRPGMHSQLLEVYKRIHLDRNDALPE